MPSLITCRNGEYLQFEASSCRPPQILPPAPGLSAVAISHGSIGLWIDIGRTRAIEVRFERTGLRFFVGWSEVHPLLKAQA